MPTWRSGSACRACSRGRGADQASIRCGSGCADSSCAPCTRPAGRPTRSAVFEDARQLLAAQLGVDPSPALSDVHLAILRAELPAARRHSPAPARAPQQPARPAHDLCGPR